MAGKETDTGIRNRKNRAIFNFLIVFSGMFFLSGCFAHNNMSQKPENTNAQESVTPIMSGKAQTNSKSKVVIITGSASGFGKAAAEKLIARGYTVYGGDINTEGNKYLDKAGGTALVMDVRKDDQVQAGIQRIMKEQGRIDVLINNAGYGEYGTIENVNIEDLKNQFDVNVFGYARLQQAVLPIMRKQRSGRVIVVSSGLGKFSMPVLGWYAASKHAVEGMADALRLEVKQFNIDVVKIQPGASNTNFTKTAYARLERSNVPEDYKKMAAGFKAGLDGLLAKAGGPEETADAIVEAVEAEKPEISYVTMRDARDFIAKRDSMTEKEFYDMLSQ